MTVIVGPRLACCRQGGMSDIFVEYASFIAPSTRGDVDSSSIDSHPSSSHSLYIKELSLRSLELSTFGTKVKDSNH